MSYRPQPVLRVFIPKPDGRQRPLGIPTVRDRVVQQACKISIEPIFEANVQDHSDGVRPGRSAAQAVKAVKEHMVQHRLVHRHTHPESARGAARCQGAAGGEGAAARRLVPSGITIPEGPNLAAFRQALRHLGYVEGQTMAIEYRYALGRWERIPDLVAELVGLQVDILVVGSNPAAVAAKQATQAIPIVFLGGGDPVRSGLVASLARPGGNLTGLFFAFIEGFGEKWVEFLKEAVPAVSQVALLHHSSNLLGTGSLKDIQSAAQALGLTLQPFSVSEPGEIDGAFAMMSEQRAGALIVDGSPFLFTHHNRVVDLAAQHRLPAMYPFRDYVDAGGLMSYGIRIADLWWRAATYVDKILKGAKPADLPMEQPMQFELVINLKTAQALGLPIPPTLLFQADKVIK